MCTASESFVNATSSTKHSFLFLYSFFLPSSVSGSVVHFNFIEADDNVIQFCLFVGHSILRYIYVHSIFFRMFFFAVVVETCAAIAQ